MPKPRPMWRRAVDSIEGRVAAPLEGLVRHENTTLALSIGSRALAGAKSQAERTSRTLLHALNLPTASDLVRLLEHISQVEHELHQLRASSLSGRSARTPSRPRGLPSSEDA